MIPSFSREQILEVLRAEIVECLACEPDDVQPGATFFTDLEGESIDVLDVSFRMQKKCGVRAPFQELVQNLEFDANGSLSHETVQKLDQTFPLIKWLDYTSAMKSNDPRDLLTVNLIADMLFHSQFDNANGGTVAEPVHT